MSTSTNTDLFNALGFFLEKMRPYVIAVIEKAAPGKPWESELFSKLGPDQKRIWNLSQRNLLDSGGNTANLIDYNILFSFGLSYKDDLKKEVGYSGEVNTLINYFKELKEVRNKCQHFQELDDDDITRAFLNLKGVAKMLEMQDLYDEIQRIQNGVKMAAIPAQAQPAPTTVLTPKAAPKPVANGDEVLPAWFNNAIPHYLIYDREGQLVKAIRGWSDVETMMVELSKVK